MKNFIIGLIVGVIIGSTVIAFADMGVLYDIYNQLFGTTSNPIYVEVI